MRKIELTLTDEFVNATETVAKNTLHAAIGYLASWAHHNERYQSVTIYGSRSGNLTASYRNAAGEVTYNLLGQLEEGGRYSFHS